MISLIIIPITGFLFMLIPIIISSALVEKINQFRKGEIDEWRNVLPKNLIQKIEKKFEKQMKELGYL